ncbi:hypothetical protein CU635_19895 [Bacillus canaveralius]|uniref:Uncharacterized protein n=1 Tax=Bacillus canaveralius TaxID=1403243 RepID=A0A2N5GH45_9BACI|nr:hypothetical protein CU635_19895 [Bacillus canaveralius]
MLDSNPIFRMIVTIIKKNGEDVKGKEFIFSGKLRKCRIWSEFKTSIDHMSIKKSTFKPSALSYHL